MRLRHEGATHSVCSLPPCGGGVGRGVGLAVLSALALTACNMDSGTGYVEIKAIPPSASIPLYLDQVKLDPLRNGNAVLRQKVGTMKLMTDIDGAGHMAFLCNIEVKKNRITSITVSVMARQPRCQCGRTHAGETGPNRTCIG